MSVAATFYADVLGSDAPLTRVDDSAEAKLDPYEAKYMSTGGAVVFRSKLRSNWKVPAYTGALAAFIAVWGATHANLAVGLVSAFLILFTGVMFSVLRVVISSTHVDVQYGIFGPKIPLSAIKSVEPVIHGYQSLFRWGITPLRSGEWLYTVAGDEGRAVKITWTTGRGKRRVHYLGSHDHERLAAAIDAARGEAGDRPLALIRSS